MMLRVRGVVVWVTLLAVSCTGARTDVGGAGAEVDALFAEYAGDGSPGAAVIVIREGSILHSAGYGLADLESGLPLSPTTPVRLGSLGKAFTAMAIVLLEEQGELSYDDPATRWVPELARFEGITVRHLLNHTSGLPDYYGNPAMEEAATAPGRDTWYANAEAVAIYETWGEPVFAPGERYEYSNPGYEVLALIVERASGAPLGPFLREHVFEPRGMSTAAVRDRPGAVLPGRAIGYSPDTASGSWTENDDHWGNWLVGAGGVYASLEDLYAWDQALWEWSEDGRLREVFMPASLNDGSVSEYGFGWGVSDHLGRPAVHHTGGWVGFRTAIVRFLDEKLTIAVLTNSTGPAAELRDSVASIYLGQ